MNKEIDKIGIVLRREEVSSRQLERMYKLVVVEGERSSTISVYGPNSNQGRRRIRSTIVSNNESPRVARQLCNSFKILRDNVEIKSETEED